MHSGLSRSVASYELRTRGHSRWLMSPMRGDSGTWGNSQPTTNSVSMSYPPRHFTANLSVEVIGLVEGHA